MYDYETLVNRSNQGSSKWNAMLKDRKIKQSDIPPLSVADCDMVYPPELINGLKDFISSDVFGYSIPTNEYYKSIYNWFKVHHNQEFLEEDIVLSPGVVNGLFNLVKTFSKKKEGVIVFSPVYYPFGLAVIKTGRTLIECELLRDEKNKYSINFDLFEKIASEKNNKILIFCSPHNPIGRVWKKEELQRVSNICNRYGIKIISDEIHCDLILFKNKHTCFLEVNKNAIICTAPSKTFNLAGLQTSNIIFKNHDYKKQFEEHMESSGFSHLNSVGMKACELAYSKCGAWLDGFISLIENNHKLCDTFIKQNISQMQISPLEGTYLQWINCHNLNLDDKNLDEFLRYKAYIYPDAGYIFGKGGEGFTRLNIATPTKVLEDALNRLLQATRRDL